MFRVNLPIKESTKFVSTVQPQYKSKWELNKIGDSRYEVPIYGVYGRLSEILPIKTLISHCDLERKTIQAAVERESHTDRQTLKDIHSGLERILDKIKNDYENGDYTKLKEVLGIPYKTLGEFASIGPSHTRKIMKNNCKSKDNEDKIINGLEKIVREKRERVFRT